VTFQLCRNRDISTLLQHTPAAVVYRRSFTSVAVRVFAESNFDMGMVQSSGSKLFMVRRTTDRTCAAFRPEVGFDMKGRAVFVLFGLRTLGAYALGYRSALRPGARHGDGFAVRFCSTRPSQRARQRSSPSRPRPHAPRPHRRHPQRLVCQTKNPQQTMPSARSGPRSRPPPLQRSSSKLVALSTMRAVGRAPPRTIPCETAGPVAAGALTPDLAGLRLGDKGGITRADMLLIHA